MLKFESIKSAKIEKKIRNKNIRLIIYLKIIWKEKNNINKLNTLIYHNFAF